MVWFSIENLVQNIENISIEKITKIYCQNKKTPHKETSFVDCLRGLIFWFLYGFLSWKGAFAVIAVRFFEEILQFQNRRGQTLATTGFTEREHILLRQSASLVRRQVAVFDKMNLTVIWGEFDSSFEFNSPQTLCASIAQAAERILGNSFTALWANNRITGILTPCCCSSVGRARPW